MSGGRFSKTHGMSKSPTYKSWEAMIDRCCNPRSQNFTDYGGRGIGVYAPWREFVSFLADMGQRPPATTLGRIDNNRGYEPGNVEWQSTAAQAYNKRNTRSFVVGGVAMTSAEARAAGFSVKAAYAREAAKKSKEASLRRRESLTQQDIEKAKQVARRMFR